MATYGYVSNSELYHHGIKGQKWGVRKDRDFYKVGLHGKNGKSYGIRVARSKAGYKELIKKHGKRAAIGAGVAAAALGTGAAIGLGINAANKNKHKPIHNIDRDPVFQNYVNSEVNRVGQDKINDYMMRKRAKDINRQMRNGRGINYI